MELVNLFKELMKRGWKVYWEYDKLMSYWQTRWKRDFWFWVLWEIKYSLRELVSKESGLWQFVCKNGIRPKRVWYAEHYWQRDHHTNWRWMVMESEPEYRIMESSLKHESELEQFLIENIKI